MACETIAIKNRLCLDTPHQVVIRGEFGDISHVDGEKAWCVWDVVFSE